MAFSIYGRYIFQLLFKPTTYRLDQNYQAKQNFFKYTSKS